MATFKEQSGVLHFLPPHLLLETYMMIATACNQVTTTVTKKTCCLPRSAYLASYAHVGFTTSSGRTQKPCRFHSAKLSGSLQITTK